MTRPEFTIKFKQGALSFIADLVEVGDDQRLIYLANIKSEMVGEDVLEHLITSFGPVTLMDDGEGNDFLLEFLTNNTLDQSEYPLDLNSLRGC